MKVIIPQVMASLEELYILQIRNQDLKKQTSFSSFVPSPHEMELVGHDGLGNIYKGNL